MPKILGESLQYSDELSVAWAAGTKCTITIESTSNTAFYESIVPAIKELCGRLSGETAQLASAVVKIPAESTAPKQNTDIVVKAALGGNIPEVTEADKAEAHRLAKALADAQARLTSLPVKPDPLARWLGADGQPPKQRPRWNVGRQYNYVDIAQADTKQIDPHGECWVLKLANGDSVLTDLEGKELEYTMSDPALVAPEWMNPTGDLPAAVTLPIAAPAPSVPTPAPTRAPVELPQDVRSMRKVSAVLEWLRNNHPEVMKAEADTVKWLWTHREQLTCTKGLKEPDVVRRVEVAFTIA